MIKPSQISVTRIVGILLGCLGFLFPFIISLPGLSFAGHIALSIFLMAALFWMLEPIPIYATSLLVIFLGVLLLSGQGPIYKGAEISIIQAENMGDNQWKVPKTSVHNDTAIKIKEGDVWVDLDIDVSEYAGEYAIITTIMNLSVIQIAEHHNHRLINYTPGRHSDYMGTLANPIIILFLGGFMIAEGAVKFNFDKNITRYLLRPFGTSPAPILIGLMIVTASLSAFMSNTATTAMMMTVIIPIMTQMSREDKFKTALALSIPIAANIGGIATPIGTPPNAIVIAALQKQGILISFTEWMILTLPLVIIVLAFAWWVLLKLFPPIIEHFRTESTVEFNKSNKAYIFYGIFAVTLVLWVTESIHGISSNIVAFLPIVALTMTEVLDVSDVRRLPWEVLWLVAGGIALGLYLDQTGLATYLVSSIQWDLYSGFLVISLFALVALIMSNFLSNTVTATLLMPLAISIGILQGSSTVDTIELALVIGVGTSMAMVLPISTPPNAIAISTGMVKTSEMAKSGVIIGAVGIILMLIYALVYWPFFLN
jgi:sodium-dependent dicarboxylate transporter 2/3/5